MSPPCRYFAYGSNMNPDRVAQRGLRVLQAQAAWVDNLGLRFNKAAAAHPGSGHANLVYAPGERAEGVLYELANAAEILKMDPYEKAPWNYSREVLVVTVAAESSSCVAPSQRISWTYFANPAVQRDGLLPSPDYLAHLLAGKGFLSQDYLAQLTAQATVPG